MTSYEAQDRADLLASNAEQLRTMQRVRALRQSKNGNTANIDKAIRSLLNIIRGLTQ